MTTMMHIARAEPTAKNLKAILGLIEEAKGWLALKDTDQWANPWPDEQARDDRVLRGLQGRKTWIVWDGDIPAATVTLTPRKNAAVWSKPACTCDLAERAVFIHRLITAREYAGLELGADLIDWAGLRGQRLYGAKWIRIDVWRTNKRLHEYYTKRGFEPCGFCADPAYPSGALFQMPVSAITKTSVPQFTESHGGRLELNACPSLPAFSPHAERPLLTHQGDTVPLLGSHPRAPAARATDLISGLAASAAITVRISRRTDSNVTTGPLCHILDTERMANFTAATSQDRASVAEGWWPSYKLG